MAYLKLFVFSDELLSVLQGSTFLKHPACDVKVF